MPWPSTLSSFTDPSSNQFLNAPSHSGIETAQNTALEELQNYIGVTTGVNASVIGTLLYDIKAPGSNGGGHVQTANKGGTGQVVYAKGDILIAQSTSVLSKLSVGADNQILVADSTAAAGVKWGSGSEPTRRMYGASSSVITWSKPSALTYILVRGVAGGASGGTANTAPEFSPGGGGGGYFERKIASSLLGATVNIMVGAASSIIGGVDTVGQNTLFGTFCSAQGGSGQNIDGQGEGGPGGSVLGGDINIPGQRGGAGTNTGVLSGFGGASHWGFGGGGKIADGAGNDASGFGAGGGGAVRTGGSNRTGGTGSNGFLIIDEY